MIELNTNNNVHIDVWRIVTGNIRQSVRLRVMNKVWANVWDNVYENVTSDNILIDLKYHTKQI